MSRLSVESPAGRGGVRYRNRWLETDRSIELSAAGVKEAEKQTVRVRSHSALSHLQAGIRREQRRRGSGRTGRKWTEESKEKRNNTTNSRKEEEEIQEP